MSTDIGIIGLGLLGRAIAQRLLAAGCRVAGYDIAEQACSEARDLGVEVMADAQSVAQRATTLILSLMTSENRRALLWGGQDVASALKPGAIILDTTTARPEDVRRDHARLAEESGVRLIDVCVAGSSQMVASGHALALIGDTEKRAGYRAVVKAFTRKQFFFDSPGRGNEAKLIANLVIGLHRLVLAEALGVARKAGFDLADILEMLAEGPTHSSVMDTKGPKMVAGHYEPPEARLAQHAKDVGLIFEYAHTLGARTPLTEAHRSVIQEVVDAGYGHLDNAAIFKAFD